MPACAARSVAGMPRYIVEIRNPEDNRDRRLVVWSTVVDAPITFGMRPVAFVDWYLDAHSSWTAGRLLADLELVRLRGTTEPGATSWVDTLEHNRAGEGERRASVAEIWQRFVVKPERDAVPSPVSVSWTGSPDVEALRDFAAAWEAA